MENRLRPIQFAPPDAQGAVLPLPAGVSIVGQGTSSGGLVIRCDWDRLWRVGPPYLPIVTMIAVYAWVASRNGLNGLLWILLFSLPLLLLELRRGIEISVLDRRVRVRRGRLPWLWTRAYRAAEITSLRVHECKYRLAPNAFAIVADLGTREDVVVAKLPNRAMAECVHRLVAQRIGLLGPRLRPVD